MFGQVVFGNNSFGTSQVLLGTYIIESSSTMQGVGAVGGGAVSVWSGSGSMIATTLATGGLVAVRGSVGSLIGTSVVRPGVVAVIGSSAKMQGFAEAFGTFSAVINSSSTMFGELKISGSQLRAYDQLFPALVVNGDTVIVGSRLYIWRSSLGRWAPAGRVSAAVVMTDSDGNYITDELGNHITSG